MENKGYFIYEVGNMGGNSPGVIKILIFVTFVPSRKDLVNCDIKIDDRIDNLKGNGEKILFTAYHNKSVDNEELEKLGIKRMNSWQEIEKYLLGD